jgi:CelD/BcsL family acetyltransferase involved in cellulose biosynthesis
MRVRRFNYFADLVPWAEDWDRLARGVPFRGWNWASAWWRHYGEDRADRRLAVLGVFDPSDSLVGIAPWYCEGQRCREIRFLGSGEVCSDYLTLLAHRGLEKAVSSSVAHWLLRANDVEESESRDAMRWSMIELTGVDSRDVMVDWLAEHLALGGCTLHHSMGQPCRRAKLPRTVDAYLSSLSKNRRKKVARLKRDLFDSGRAELHTVARMNELQPAMDCLIDLHQRRHQSLGRPGCFDSAPFAAFHREVASRLLAQGQLQLHVLRLDRKPIAAEYQLTGNGVLYAYQGGIDPTRLDFQPGHAMQLAMLTWAINNGYRAYDFLRGNELYKSHWNAQRRDCIDVRIIAPDTGAQLRHVAWVAGTEAKQWIRRGWDQLKRAWE